MLVDRLSRSFRKTGFPTASFYSRTPSSCDSKHSSQYQKCQVSPITILIQKRKVLNSPAPPSPQETIHDPLSTSSSSSSTSGRTESEKKAKKLPSWVTQTMQSASEDRRRQPWKETFGESVDCRFDD